MTATFSPAAEEDLLDIAVFIAQDNPARALTFVDELESKCDALGRAPGIGTSRPELGARRGYRAKNELPFTCLTPQLSQTLTSRIRTLPRASPTHFWPPR